MVIEIPIISALCGFLIWYGFDSRKMSYTIGGLVVFLLNLCIVINLYKS